MSVKRRKAALTFSWQRSFSILAPWRKGKGDLVLDGEVVLTKMKLLQNFDERLAAADDSLSTASTASVPEPARASEASDDLSEPPLAEESGSDYLSAIFSDSQLPRLYKFESEDSGVELPSGANSPSTPTGSEQSFVVHSRGSSCDSGHLKPPSSGPDGEAAAAGESEDNPPNTTTDHDESTLVAAEGLDLLFEKVDSHLAEPEVDGGGPEDTTLEEHLSGSEHIQEHLDATEEAFADGVRPRSQSSAGLQDIKEGDGVEQPALRKSTTSDSLEEYMEECCRLSEKQQAASGSGSNPLGSGLGYLEHICQLIEKIGQLQETNLRLQRQICGLQRDGRVTRTKEDFFQQHCSCGAADLAFQDPKKRPSRNECLSPSGTLSDLSTIPEVARHPLYSMAKDRPLAPVPLWRRGLNRRSYTEGESRFLCDGSEGLAVPQRRLSENYTWGRVKDLVRRTKMRNQSRLGLTTTSLKMSCPQLYRPDLGPMDLPRRNRSSMITLGHPDKLDCPWLQ